jgi:predicted enzyme related to lactoylglutathione lyase
MPKRLNEEGGHDMPRPVHFDLGAKDPARAIAFYKAAFGWTVEKWNGPFEYYLIKTGESREPRAGHMVSCKDTEENVFGLMEEKMPDQQHVELGEMSGV